MVKAEGDAQAVKTRAEAERFRELTVADGESQAIRSVYRAILELEPTPELIAIKYLETLEKMAAGDANKIFMPFEASAALGSLAAIRELWENRSEARGAAPGH